MCKPAILSAEDESGLTLHGCDKKSRVTQIRCAAFLWISCFYLAVFIYFNLLLQSTLLHAMRVLQLISHICKSKVNSIIITLTLYLGIIPFVSNLFCFTFVSITLCCESDQIP